MDRGTPEISASAVVCSGVVCPLDLERDIERYGADTRVGGSPYLVDLHPIRTREVSLMRLLTATALTQGTRDNDYNCATEGELVSIDPMCD